MHVGRFISLASPKARVEQHRTCLPKARISAKLDRGVGTFFKDFVVGLQHQFFGVAEFLSLYTLVLRGILWNVLRFGAQHGQTTSTSTDNLSGKVHGRSTLLRIIGMLVGSPGSMCVVRSGVGVVARTRTHLVCEAERGQQQVQAFGKAGALRRASSGGHSARHANV